MKLARLLAVIVFAWSFAAGIASAVSIELETVGTMSANNQAAWWSPIAEHNGKVYVSYLAPNSPRDDVFVAQRNGPNTWTVQNTGFTSRYDIGHTQTSLAVDGDGILHLFYGMHNNAITYAQSEQAASVTSGFTSSSPNAFAGGTAYTYPNLTTAANGDVYMIIRDRRPAYSGQQGRLFRFSNAANSWSEMPPFAGQLETTVYPDQVFADATGQLHLIWEWAAGGPQGARHYGSYARFDPATNTYYKADGTAYTAGPITINQADVFQGLEGSETFTEDLYGVQSAKMTIDDLGRPIIVYGYSTDGTASSFEHRVARWAGGEWIRSTVTPGPFDLDKAWITYSDGLLRLYGALSPDDPLHTGLDEIFLRTSSDYGVTWSDPILVAQGVDVQRPVGITVDDVDYLYLSSTSQGQLYVAIISVPEPTAGLLAILGFSFLCRPGAIARRRRTTTELADTASKLWTAVR